MRKNKNAENPQNGDITEIHDTAFEEDVSKTSGISSSGKSPDKRKSGGRRRNLFHSFVGAVFWAMAVIGIISTAGFISGKVKSFIDNTDQKNEFAKFIYPVVICDPPNFDQTTKLRNETIITAAVWDIILYEDKSKYELDFDYLIVPEVDVEQHAAKLFGSGLNISHVTIASSDISFYYDGELSSYRVPENPKFFTYSPYIEEITQVGESYTLTVGYVSPTPAWLTLTSDETPSPEKYVDYVVQKRGGSFTLVAIRSSAKQAEGSHNSGL